MATRKPSRAAAKPRPAPRTGKTTKATKTAPARKAARAKAAKKTRARPETLRLRSVIPGFTVNNLERSMTFYTAVLGL